MFSLKRLIDTKKPSQKIHACGFVDDNVFNNGKSGELLML